MGGKFFIFSFANIEVHEREFCLIKSGEPLPVEPKAFRVLLILLRNPKKLMPKHDLLNAVWGDVAVTENSLARSIALLRRLLGDDTRSPHYIETVSTLGYRFLCDVQVREDISSTPEPGEDIAGASRERVASQSRRKSSWKLVISLAGVAACLAAGLAIWNSRPRILTVSNIVQLTNDRLSKIPTVPPRTDGVHLYFVEGQPSSSGSGIAQVSALGGETTWITTNLREALAIPDISPDRSKLLVMRGVAVGAGLASEVWIQPLPAGSPYRVGSILASSACFTPDGSRIFYGDNRLAMTAKLDGSDPHKLASVPGLIRAPRFSLDGKVVRFWLVQPQGNATSIWQMDSDGKNLHPLLPDWNGSPDPCCGIWSPDGNYYYFQAGHGSRQAIWALPERRPILGRSPVPFRLTSGPLRFGGPSPSTDGKRLFVVGDETRVELVRYDPHAARFDSFLGGISAGPVDFSPDGKWVAYVSYPDMTLWRSRLDLTEKMQLTFPPVRAYAPRWSPDGSRIAFEDVQFGRPWTTSVLPATGGEPPKSILPAGSGDSAVDPTWSPDGQSIVFAKAAAAGEGAAAIYRLNPATGESVRIPDSEGLTSPRLSPDGRYIAALRVGARALMLFDQRTNQWSILAEGELFSYNEWSHDGAYVYMRSNQGDSADVVRVRIKDRVMEPVLSLRNFPTLVDPFANWIGVTSDGGVLLMRDRSVQEIYALDLQKK